MACITFTCMIYKRLKKFDKRNIQIGGFYYQDGLSQSVVSWRIAWLTSEHSRGYWFCWIVPSLLHCVTHGLVVKMMWREAICTSPSPWYILKNVYLWRGRKSPSFAHMNFVPSVVKMQRRLFVPITHASKNVPSNCTCNEIVVLCKHQGSWFKFLDLF